MRPRVNIFWFRRDLRLHDNHGLYKALKAGIPVLPLFIFDRNILDGLEDKGDRRVEFIHASLQDLQSSLLKTGAALDTRYGFPLEIFRDLLMEYEVEKVFTNHDYEPYARSRDAAIAAMLAGLAVQFYSLKDQVIFEKDEVVKDNGKPYTIFTPYSRKWLASFKAHPPVSFDLKKYSSRFFQQSARQIPSLSSMGFTSTGQPFPRKKWDQSGIQHYKDNRDQPALNGTSKLSVHLRFGTISIRELVLKAGSLNDTFLKELIWRDFYQMILWHFPNVVENSFKPEYDKIIWRNNELEFHAWCEGRTGYPIVDAGMRELNVTGFMHNRVRMIVASFLTKHLLIDWRWGEAYFAQKLLDYDLAANNGGWQWAAGSGCDAAPYFRIFNPYLQTKKFDPEFKYIRQWVPEFEEFTYPCPIVDHEFARKRCLETYGAALRK